MARISQDRIYVLRLPAHFGGWLELRSVWVSKDETSGVFETGRSFSWYKRMYCVDGKGKQYRGDFSLIEEYGKKEQAIKEAEEDKRLASMYTPDYESYIKTGVARPCELKRR